VRLFVVSRHGQSVLNVEERVNGDPRRPVPLTPQGEKEAALLGLQVAHFHFDVCLHTRFPRTRRTAEIALGARGIPYAEEPLFDDVQIGDFDGAPTVDYRKWKEAHTRRDRFPNGESLVEAAERYADGLQRLADSDYGSVFLVCHDIPLRYLLNAAAGSHWLDGPIHDVPNATAFLFDEAALRRAAPRIRELAAIEA
jgi:2,3-bisphosphoglycerate-dependent phosphoglycerate mutase